MNTVTEKLKKSARGQVMPRRVEPVGKEAFSNIEHTEIRWLGSASILINSRGTTLLLTPSCFMSFITSLWL